VLLTLAAAAAHALPAAGAARLSEQGARMALLAAWLLHAATLAWSLFTDPPRFGFAPALSVTAWLVLTVYAVERQMFPQLQARWALAGLGAAAVLLAMLFPGNTLQMAASPWLPLHWALGISSYGLFAAAVVHAWLMMRAEKHIRVAADPHAGVPLLTLERLTFRFATAGFVLLSATLVAGLFFSEKLYGQGHSGIRWDHKTVFSMLAWTVFAFLLLARLRFGWRGRKAVRILYTGSLLLLLAYAGSRFVLEVVLGRAA
jgi:ABC-type uncharacterized transport system permease subunit